MPKRYKPSERKPTPTMINQEYVLFLTGSNHWVVGTWIDGYDEYPNGGFECEDFMERWETYRVYPIDQIDWWLDPMEVDDEKA